MSARPDTRPWLRTVLLALSVAALLALVALASRGHAWSSGGGSPRRLSRTFWDYVLTLTLVAWLVGAAVALWFYATIRKEWRGSRGYGRRIHPIAAALFAGIVLGLALAYVEFAPRNGHLLGRRAQTVKNPAPGAAQHVKQKALQHAGEEPHFRWIAAAIALALVAAVVVALVVRHRRRLGPLKRRATAAEALAEMLDDTLEDLRRERDPRRAVIAAYARMERTLAANGLPRNAFEAPLEYLARVLVELQASVGSVTRLTDLFERAKFSQHEIDAGMKDEAIEALVSVRAELAAA